MPKNKPLVVKEDRQKEPDPVIIEHLVFRVEVKSVCSGSDEEITEDILNEVSARFDWKAVLARVELLSRDRA